MVSLGDLGEFKECRGGYITAADGSGGRSIYGSGAEGEMRDERCSA